MKFKCAVIAGVAMFGIAAFAADVGKSTPKGFTDDFEAAKAEAKKSGKKIFAVFSGSDWCYWCKKLEQEYLSKPDFVEAAKKDFVLVFIDNPNNQSLLSETGKKNNRALTTKYGIRGFPTAKIMDADGNSLLDDRPKGNITPKKYAEQLSHDVKVIPLVEKHLKPFEKEIEDLMKAESAKAQEKASTAGEFSKADFEAEKKDCQALLAKLKDIRKRAGAAKMPAEIAADSKAFQGQLDEMIKGMEKFLKMSWEDVQKLEINKKAK